MAVRFFSYKLEKKLRAVKVNTLVTLQTSHAASQVFLIFQFLNGVTGTLEISKEILKMMSVQ